MQDVKANEEPTGKLLVYDGIVCEEEFDVKPAQHIYNSALDAEAYADYGCQSSIVDNTSGCRTDSIQNVTQEPVNKAVSSSNDAACSPEPSLEPPAAIEEDPLSQTCLASLKNTLEQDCGPVFNLRFFCNRCQASFSSSTGLFRHISIHHAYICSFCDKSFRMVCHLRNHTKMHTKKRTRVKKFACEWCDVSFDWKSQLQKHIRVHNPDNL